MHSPPPAQGPEVRIDPEDGQPRTLQELKQLCMGRYSEKEIEDYWNQKCVPHVGEAIVNIANDPFLTHQSRISRPPTATAPPSQGGPSAQSMLPPGPPPVGSGGSLGEGAVDVSKDPFMTLADRKRPPAMSPMAGYDVDGTLRAKRQQELSTSNVTMRHWTESLFALLGRGDPDRDLSTKSIHMFAPFMVFLWVILLWVLLRHYSFHATIVITVALCIGFAGMVFVWCMGRRGGSVPYLGLGLLCLLAVVAGVMVGETGWEQYWRQYWWTQTGYRNGLTSASTPAGARTDFAVVNFWNAAAGGTVNNTQVDHAKSAGYKDGHHYCVAPILSPDTAGVGLVLVNYWAVGIDCCQQLGSFTCDASREYDGGYGVVMLEGGQPCPTCNNANFKSAVAKAEAMHGLVSANEAVFVRWVKNPTTLQMTMLAWALLFIAVSSLAGLAFFAMLGWLTWYYGVGKLPPGVPDVGLHKQVD